MFNKDRIHSYTSYLNCKKACDSSQEHEEYCLPFVKPNKTTWKKNTIDKPFTLRSAPRKTVLDKGDLAKYDYQVDTHCTACGVMNHLFMVMEYVPKRWACDECGEWNNFDEILKRNTKIIKDKPTPRPIIIKFPTLISKERKARIRAKFSKIEENFSEKIWRKKNGRKYWDTPIEIIAHLVIPAGIGLIPLILTSDSVEGANDAVMTWSEVIPIVHAVALTGYLVLFYLQIKEKGLYEFLWNIKTFGKFLGKILLGATTIGGFYLLFR